MGLFDRLFRKKPSGAASGKTVAGKPKVIKTLADVRVFFVAATEDEALGKLLAEVVEQTGRYGYLAIERTGMGEPYSFEFLPCPEENKKLSVAEVQKKISELQQQIAAAALAPERDPLERKLAALAGGVCVLRIRSASSPDFKSRSDAIRKAWAEFKEIAKN